MSKTIIAAALLLCASSVIARDIPIRNASATCAWITVYRPIQVTRRAGRTTYGREKLAFYWLKAGESKTQHWPDSGEGAEVRAEFMTNVNCQHPVVRDISKPRWRRDGWPREFVLSGRDRSSYEISIK